MFAKLMKFLKFITKLTILVGILVIAVIFYANWKIPHESQKYIYKDIDSIPEHSVALVLGTSRYIGSTPNIYFTNRIQAAKELYEAGKIDAFVVSGDNRHMSYNEPRDMKKALIEAGVPDSIIHADYAGFRTLDSVIRMNKVFGQKSYIIVSQEFHNERAIYIARHHDIEAYGYNAKDLSLNRASYRTKIRELFARVKVFIDIIIGKAPKFLGEPIDIPLDAYNKDSLLEKQDSLLFTTDSLLLNNEDSILRLQKEEK